MSFEAAAELTGNEPTVLIGLSKCAFALGDVDEAVQFATRAANADTRDNLRYTRHLASMLMAQPNWPEAQRVAEKCLATAQASAREDGQTRTSLETLKLQYRLLIEVLNRRSKAAPDRADIYVNAARHMQLKAENAARLALYDVLRVLDHPGLD